MGPGERAARFVARNPLAVLVLNFVSSVILGATGMAAGGFSVSANNAGWRSRGTLIASRAAQFQIVNKRADLLRGETHGGLWDEYQSKPVVIKDEEDEERRVRRSLNELAGARRPNTARRGLGDTEAGAAAATGSPAMFIEMSKECPTGWHQPTTAEECQSAHPDRHLMDCKDWDDAAPRCFTRPDSNTFCWKENGADSTDLGSTMVQCKPDFSAKGSASLPTNLPPFVTNTTVYGYGYEGLTDATWVRECDFVRVVSNPDHVSVVATWKARDRAKGPTHKDTLRTLCESEKATAAALVDKCLRCYSGAMAGKCAPPQSIVTLARVLTGTSADASCASLANAYEAQGIEGRLLPWLQACANAKRAKSHPPECSWFDARLIDSAFDENSGVLYSSSTFPLVPENLEELAREMLDRHGRFDRAGGSIDGTYDMTDHAMEDAFLDDALSMDMILSCAAAIIVVVAIFVHTQSPWLTMCGFFQVALSFPTAFTIYRFAVGLSFFPFLNFIGVFVIFGALVCKLSRAERGIRIAAQRATHPTNLHRR